jgi:16S rRNA (cytosine1402-N4)-methyltransferase
MEVNNEMGVLESMLSQVPDVLNPGGRVAIITFHSIEDRMVKNFFRQGSFIETPSHPFLPDNKEDVFTVITKKPITATEEELKNNTRSRSAKLRIAEKN